MHYFNDGADGFVWDPLYRKRSGLTPCEQEILMHPALRRLQRIAHYATTGSSSSPGAWPWMRW